MSVTFVTVYILIVGILLQPCVRTESMFGDGVDNDCDGLIDEELCTGDNRGTDTDGDEFVDEDCALIREQMAGMYYVHHVRSLLRNIALGGCLIQY